WSTVFNWRGPVYRKPFLEGEVLANPPRMSRPNSRDHRELSRMIPPLVAMKETTSFPLLLPLITFLLYWILGGPGVFWFLKRKRKVRHAWLGFVAVVLAFSLVTWSGAWLLRPAHERIAHLSVLDIDLAQQTMHTHSWLSLFVPNYVNVDLKFAT